MDVTQIAFALCILGWVFYYLSTKYKYKIIDVITVVLWGAGVFLSAYGMALIETHKHQREYQFNVNRNSVSIYGR